MSLLQLLVASAGVFNVVRFRMDNLLLEETAGLDRLTLAALAAILVLTVGVVGLCWRAAVLSPRHVALAVLLIGLTMLSGFAPQVVEARGRAAAQAALEAERQQRHQTAAHELLAWTDEVDRRSAETHPFDQDRAWEFLDSVSGAGYWDEGADPLSLRALALLRRALASRLIDVNAGVRSHRFKDETARPLFLQFYGERVEPLRHALARQDWEIMKLLAAAGADLALPEAAPLVADLAKTEQSGPSRFVTLK